MNWRRHIARLVALLTLLLALDWAAASWLVWSNYHQLATLLRDPARLRGQYLRLSISRSHGKPYPLSTAELSVPDDSTAFRLAFLYDNAPIELISNPTETRLTAVKTQAHFLSDPGELTESRRALADLARALPSIPLRIRIGLSLVLRPLIIGLDRVKGEPCLLLVYARGHASFGLRDGQLHELTYQDHQWTVSYLRKPLKSAAPTEPPSIPSQTVDRDDLDKSLAALVRIASLPLAEVPRDTDSIRREGDGALEIRNGQRILRLSGRPYEIGFQHGRLLAPNIKRLVDRVIFGIGLRYSLEKGQWFLNEAARLVERQRPFVAPEYAEEMRGLADGAGLPLEMLEAANVFPEFFHCSGAALFGKATRNGTLLHARVLDYMSGVGLQDEAVLMLVDESGDPPGYYQTPRKMLRFVNVGYAGFIGCVTGMNEAQLAIGEMGGRGEGQWDGVPMALLLRSALQKCSSCDQALEFMRTQRRTCEYFYVISDGKNRTARGVAATPEKFEIIEPGKAVPQLPEAIDDVVLMSADRRYRELVKRVRAAYGQIGPRELQQIITRPVAGGSNLHNAIFEPTSLTLWIAHASRFSPACDQPYTMYKWAELFPENK